MTPTQKYLDVYAEKETRLIDGIDDHFRHAVAVPLHDEESQVAEPLFVSLEEAARDKVLAIVVVNAPVTAPSEVHATNARMLEWLKRRSGRALGPAAWYSPSSTVSYLVIDRASSGNELPAKQGVGLARKLGCDIALALCHAGKVESSRISTTDADARVDGDYFSGKDRASPQGGLSDRRDVAWIHPYNHGSEGEDVEAHSLYELSLRYYVRGLAHAGSPYAFPTIGSTMTFDAAAYAEARGFPKYQAAEDFYLLDKLAKLGRVVSTSGRVRLRPRLSARVPFGTGIATRKIARLAAEKQPFSLYNPGAFECLRRWQDELARFAREGETSEVFKRLQTDEDGELITGIVKDFGAPRALEVAARTRPRPADRARHLHTWFDALATLRFIHEAHSRRYPKLPVEEALSSASFLPECGAGYDPANGLEDGW